ncbi:MAG: hypothetical protein QXY75_03085 [Candidatus Bathyarchaeia archaeon]
MGEDRMRYLIIRQSEIDDFVKTVLNYGKPELLTSPLMQRLISLSIRKPRTRKKAQQLAAPSSAEPTIEPKMEPVLPAPEQKAEPTPMTKPEEQPPALPKPYTPPPAQEPLSKWFEERRKKLLGETE